MTSRALIFITALLTLSLQPLVAADAPQSKPTPWPLPPNEFFLKQIPQPPTAGSTQDKADLTYLIVQQAHLTKEQISHANFTNGLTVFTFSEVLGPRFTPANYPRTALFFKRLEMTANIPKNFIKDHYARLRPIIAHPDLIKAYVPMDPGFSYPSGHATRSRLYAEVLSKLDISEKNAFIRCADQVAQDRIFGGMHYLSDIEASKQLADVIFKQLLLEPQFVKELKALKIAEWTPPPSK